MQIIIHPDVKEARGAIMAETDAGADGLLKLVYRGAKYEEQLSSDDVVPAVRAAVF